MNELTVLNQDKINSQLELAKIFSKAGDMIPSDFRGSPEKIFCALQLGTELGLNPMQAIRSICVINGRPILFGDAQLAIVKGSGQLEYIKEWEEGGTAFCEVKRKGEKFGVLRAYSEEDCKNNPNINNAKAWKSNKSRMKQLRARAFALRDSFPDILNGISNESEQDEIKEINITPTEQVPDNGNGSAKTAILEKLNQDKPAQTPVETTTTATTPEPTNGNGKKPKKNQEPPSLTALKQYLLDMGIEKENLRELIPFLIPGIQGKKPAEISENQWQSYFEDLKSKGGNFVSSKLDELMELKSFQNQPTDGKLPLEPVEVM